MGWGKYAPITSFAICVNPGSAFNSYWPMPFKKKAYITQENLDTKPMVVYYQIDYSKGSVPADAAYFHAQFRRVNPVPFKQVYTILDGVEDRGQYVGTYLARVCTTLAGGAKERSSFTWTETLSFPSSTARELRIISTVPMISRILTRTSTTPLPRPTRGWPRSSSPTGYITLNNGSAFIVGTFLIRYVSIAIFA